MLAWAVVNVYGQACQPDPLVTKPGVTPDSATNFVDGYVGVPYTQLVTVVVPKDTQALPLPFPKTKFDSVVMKSFTGLPASLSYACNPAKCSWPGDSKGCLIITGTPGTADTGTHKLQFVINAYLGGSTSPLSTYTLSYYRIIVHPAQSVKENGGNKLELHQNYPNPFSGKTEITFTSPVAEKLEFIVYDMLGKIKYTLPITAKRGLNKLEFDSKYLSPGIYFYALKNATSILVRRTMIVELTK